MKNASIDQALRYPAQFHFRIITEAHVDSETALRQVVGVYQVTAPLTLSRTSAEGRYKAYGIAILMRSREEMEAFDRAVKLVPGVKMLV